MLNIVKYQSLFMTVLYILPAGEWLKVLEVFFVCYKASFFSLSDVLYLYLYVNVYLLIHSICW